ncbi:MAG: hypothetical protein EHM77_06455, partial [Planctomycetaceae bacterium]
MQYQLYKSIFLTSHKKLLKPSILKNIKSFSDDPIKVHGQVVCQIRFNDPNLFSKITLTIISDIPGVPLFLFGNDSLRECCAALAFTGDKSNPTPEMVVKNPREQVVKIYYEAPRDLHTCHTTTHLKPFETKSVTFILNQAAPVLRNQEIIISSRLWGNIYVLPSKSDLEFNPNLDAYTATAQIANLTNKFLTEVVFAEFEVVTNYEYHPITKENQDRVLRRMKTQPPAREILPSSNNVEIHLPVISVCNVIIDEEGEISKEDLKHIAGANKVSYTGTADISPEIIEAGMQPPNLIHNTPEEALDLTHFDAELRPYLEDLFFKKYRNVVSLHPMDAGDLSKTLGFLSLKLIPGETLPRHKRIYHLSPQDNRYLEELLDQFIRFNYMIRAPIDKTGSHLYGMSAYLIPRK